MSKTIFLSVAKDYSPTPGPRYEAQGPHSGERFRDIVIDRLRDADKVVIDMDGTRGYGSSFIDEVFGGLVRHAEDAGFTKDDILQRIEIRSKEDPSYSAEAKEAMEQAARG